MAGIEKISVSLTAQQAAMIDTAVMSGEYASHSEVIREALRDWGQRKGARLQYAGELRQLAIEGLRSGPGRYGSVAAIKKEARRRHSAKKKNG